MTSQGPGKNVMVSKAYFKNMTISQKLADILMLPFQVCAHQYQQWSPSVFAPHLVTGQCYLLGEDLQVGKDDKRRRVVCDYEHLSRRPMDHAWFAYCQQGHGASFAKDNKSLLFGAPGAYQWKGKSGSVIFYLLVSP